MEINNKINSTKEMLELLVKNSTKHGVLLERVDDNVQKLAEGQELLTEDVTFLKTKVVQIDELLIRVEMNQVADKEELELLKGRVTVLEKKI